MELTALVALSVTQDFRMCQKGSTIYWKLQATGFYSFLGWKNMIMLPAADSTCGLLTADRKKSDLGEKCLWYQYQQDITIINSSIEEIQCLYTAFVIPRILLSFSASHAVFHRCFFDTKVSTSVYSWYCGYLKTWSFLGQQKVAAAFLFGDTKMIIFHGQFKDSMVGVCFLSGCILLCWCCTF